MPISVVTVQRVVAQHYGLSVPELLSRSNLPQHLRPRFVAIHLARELTGHGSTLLGKLFGDRDHTTILNACEQIAAESGRDAALAAEIAALSETIQRYSGSPTEPGQPNGYLHIAGPDADRLKALLVRVRDDWEAFGGQFALSFAHSNLARLDVFGAFTRFSVRQRQVLDGLKRRAAELEAKEPAAS